MASRNGGKNELWPEQVTHMEAESRRSQEPTTTTPPIAPTAPLSPTKIPPLDCGQCPLVASMQPANSLFRRRYKLTLALFTLGCISELQSAEHSVLFCSVLSCKLHYFSLGQSSEGGTVECRSVESLESTFIVTWVYTRTENI